MKIQHYAVNNYIRINSERNIYNKIAECESMKSMHISESALWQSEDWKSRTKVTIAVAFRNRSDFIFILKRNGIKQAEKD